MSNPEQQTDLAEGQVKPRSRKLLITLIVVLCVVVVLAVGWVVASYLFWTDVNNSVEGWWSEIKGAGGAGGGGDLDPGNL